MKQISIINFMKVPKEILEVIENKPKPVITIIDFRKVPKEILEVIEK